MLMCKQVLLLVMKKVFDICCDFFDELYSVDDIFINVDICYVCEVMYQVVMYDGFLVVIGELGVGKFILC